MSCLGGPQLGPGESFSTQDEGPFSFCRQVPSPSQQRPTALGTGGSSALCLSCQDRERLMLPRLLMSWAKQGKEHGVKFTGDTNLEGAGNTSSKREGKQSAEGELRNPDK